MKREETRGLVDKLHTHAHKLISKNTGLPHLSDLIMLLHRLKVQVRVVQQRILKQTKKKFNC